MSGRIMPAVPTRSGPRSPTFFIHLYYRLANSWRGGGRPQVSPSGIVDAFEAPHRAIGPYERSAQPRAQLHRTLPLHHSPDGRAPWAPSAVQAAIARNSPKKASPEETSKMADGQLARAVPVSRGTSPGELPRALYALRTVPTRKGPSVQNPRAGKGVKNYKSIHRRLSSDSFHCSAPRPPPARPRWRRCLPEPRACAPPAEHVRSREAERWSQDGHGGSRAPTARIVAFLTSVWRRFCRSVCVE